jgi:hypothetical protein
MQAPTVAGKPKPAMKASPGKGSRGSISEAQLKRTLASELRLLDEARKARRRTADQEAGRYGRTKEESIAAREKYKREHPKEKYVTPMSPQQIERNRTAAVDERIKPVPPKPKPSDSAEKTAKMNADIRRVEEQNDKARKATQDKQAAVAKPRPSTPGYVAGRSAKQRIADQEARRDDLSARQRRNPEAFKQLEDKAKAAKEARDAKAVADRAAARASRPDAVAARNAKAAADKAAADARAARAAKEAELLNKNKPKKKLSGRKR